MGKLNIEAHEAPDSNQLQSDQEHLLLKYTELSTLKEFMTSYEKSMLKLEANKTEESKSDLSQKSPAAVTQNAPGTSKRSRKKRAKAAAALEEATKNAVMNPGQAASLLDGIPDEELKDAASA